MEGHFKSLNNEFPSVESDITIAKIQSCKAAMKKEWTVYTVYE
jgi:hypothetical protein